MSRLVPLPVVLPLLGAALAILLGRWRGVQRVISVSVLVVTTVIAVVLLVEADRNGTVVMAAGGWEAPVGISLVVDRLSGLLLAISAVTLLAVLLYAMGQGESEQRHVAFHPVYLVLAAGVAASFLTGDLFNMFVAFEVMLSASYVLLTLGGRADQVRSGMTYVVISLVASALFLMTLAFVYAATGTVNLADLAEKVPTLPDGVRAGLSLLLLVVFGIKAAIFPLFFWLPDSYPTAPSPITAVFAGLLTKVGVYAILRTQTLLFPADSRPVAILLVIAALTMVVGVLGAIAQDDVKRILSFHIVSQIGYMVMGLAFFTVAGLAGAILFTANQIVVKTSLFLAGGLVERVGGSSRLSRLGGLRREAPVLAALFLLPALSLAGLPPFSGFVAKLALVEAGFDARRGLLVAISLVVSICTLISMLKIWSGSFWGRPEEEPERQPVPPGRFGGPLGMVLPAAGLVGVGLAFAVWAGPLYALSERAAADLLHPAGYIQAVLGP